MNYSFASLVPEALKSRLRGLSIVPPWTQLLPGSSASFGPPRRWARVADYVRAAGETSWEVEAAEEIRQPAARLFGEGTASFVARGPIAIPARRVFRARGMAIIGPDAHLVGKHDTLLWDAAWHEVGRDPTIGFRERVISKRKLARPRRKLAGLTAALGSDWAVGSFGHFIHDSLSRWRLLQLAGFRAGDFDQFILFHPDSVSARWFVKAAGIPEDRIVGFDPSVDLECDEVVATALGSLPPAHARGTMRWLRELALSAGTEHHERVYLSRAGYIRHPFNAPELESEMRRRGFHLAKADDGMAGNRVCLSAKIIVGVEGTNLASACFAPPGAKVVILLPAEKTFPVFPYMFEACGHATAVVGARPGTPVRSPEFPLENFRAALDWAGA